MGHNKTFTILIAILRTPITARGKLRKDNLVHSGFAIT